MPVFQVGFHVVALGPFGKSFAPPKVIFRYGVELRELVSKDFCFFHILLLIFPDAKMKVVLILFSPIYIWQSFGFVFGLC